MAAHAVRIIDGTRRRGAVAVAVNQDAFDAWNDQMRCQGKAAPLFLTTCNLGLSPYFVNSQQDTVYHRPQTIIGSRKFSRRSPLTDYDFQHRPASRPEPAPQAKELSA